MQKLQQLYINNYRILNQFQLQKKCSILEAQDVFKQNKEVILKIIQVPQVQNNINPIDVETKILMIALVQSIQMQTPFITRCTDIICPIIPYIQNNQIVLPPQMIQNINKNSKMEYQQNQNNGSRFAQFNIQNTITKLKSSYTIVEEKADCNLEQDIQAGETAENIRIYLFQILQAINTLHENNICHNDIKSSNVLIFKQYKEAKLNDFESCMILGKNQYLYDEDKQKLLKRIITNPMYSPLNIVDPVNTTIQFSPKEDDNPMKLKEGKLADIWQFGQMAIFCFTQQNFNTQIIRNSSEYAFFSKNFSHEFADFISLCTETQSLRPSASILLKHPFFVSGSLTDFHFDLKEELCQRLYQNKTKVIRSCSLPNTIKIDNDNIINFNIKRKNLLTDISSNLRNEIGTNEGTNNDKITDLIMYNENQYKIKRSQSCRTNYNKKQNFNNKIEGIDLVVNNIINMTAQPDSQFLDNFVIDKLVNADIDLVTDNRYYQLQKNITINNCLLLSSACSLTSIYFDDILQEQYNYKGQYEEIKSKILKYKEQIKFQKDFYPLQTQSKNQSARSSQSISSARIKNLSSKGSSSIISGRNMQREFSRSYIQMVESVRKSINQSYSNFSDTSLNYSSHSIVEDHIFQSPQIKSLNQPQIQKLEMVDSDSSDLLPQMSDDYILPPQPKDKPFDLKLIKNDEEYQSARSGNLGNLSLNLSQSNLESARRLNSVSKTSNELSEGIKDLFEIQQENTEESSQERLDVRNVNSSGLQQLKSMQFQNILNDDDLTTSSFKNNSSMQKEKSENCNLETKRYKNLSASNLLVNVEDFSVDSSSLIIQ